MTKYYDLTGMTFGNLYVIKRHTNPKSNQCSWLCLCKCKREIVCVSQSLKRGTKSCRSCSAKDMIRTYKDMIGQKIGRLKVLKRDLSKKKVYWECVCDCGNLKSIASYDLKRGNTTSCGCYLLELLKKPRKSDEAKKITQHNKYLRKVSTNLGKLIERVRCNTRTALYSRGVKKNTKTEKILGCTFEQFKYHIESLFTEGMSWETFSKIHIDHIIPISSAKTEQDVILLSHYTNLQPLWAKDNLKKGG